MFDYLLTDCEHFHMSFHTFLHFKYHVKFKNVIFTGKFHMFYFFHRLFTCFSHVFHPVVRTAKA